MLALTLPMWPAWLAERATWTATLATQGESAPLWVAPFAVIGLVLLGRERAAWLVVPALWPSGQLYYAVLALPVLAGAPLVALSLAIPIPGLVAFGMLGQVAARQVSRALGV